MSSNPKHTSSFADCNEYFDDERSFLEARLHHVEQEISRRRTCSELYQRIWMLEKHLQAPDSSSEFSKYEQALSALADATRRLYYARANRSWFRDLLSSLDLIESIAELEDFVWAHSTRVERLRLRLRLSGHKTLQEEYHCLVDRLDRSIKDGISPGRNYEEICKLDDERAQIVQILMRAEKMAQFEEASFEVTVMDTTATSDFGPPASEDPKLSARRQTVFTDSNYWDVLKVDLLSAQKTLVVVCPYLTMRRTCVYTEIFEELLARNVVVRVITLPSGVQKEHMADQSALVMKKLLDLGIELITVPKIHQKIILVDEKVCWDGSMNWLSHKDTAEHMRRNDNLSEVAEVSESLSIYLKPLESEPDQPMVVTINKLNATMDGGTSVVVQQIVNASPEQIESMLFDCDIDCAHFAKPLADGTASGPYSIVIN